MYKWLSLVSLNKRTMKIAPPPSDRGLYRGGDLVQAPASQCVDRARGPVKHP